jgi:hypothetical protein
MIRLAIATRLMKRKKRLKNPSSQHDPFVQHQPRDLHYMSDRPTRRTERVTINGLSTIPSDVKSRLFRITPHSPAHCATFISGSDSKAIVLWPQMTYG